MKWKFDLILDGWFEPVVEASTEEEARKVLAAMLEALQSPHHESRDPYIEVFNVKIDTI